MELLIKCFLLFTGRKSPDSWHIIGIENAFNWCYELRKQKTGFFCDVNLIELKTDL